jgi:hypothetical protein
MDPPEVAKAEEFALRREQLGNTEYHKLQTALLLFHVAADHERAVAKLREAVDRSRSDGDDETLYSSLSVLGLALLKLDRRAESVAVLKEIEAIVDAKKPFIAGDETRFLEHAHREGLEIERVKRYRS